jgi:pyrroloquinoline quinone (PQQ) biosynthesis protein C
VVDNQRFFDETLERAKQHRFYSHPFLTAFDAMTPSRDVVSFMLTSFYKVVSPFTGLLCTLGGRAPDLRSRFALMDNIFEEMGRGDLSAAHPSLYLKMLSSIGVPPDVAEGMRTLTAIGKINSHLTEVVESRSFSVACAVLASAEAAIPPLFPVLATITRRAFPEVDMAFFDRHGGRDEGHANDAAMLFAVTADGSDLDLVDVAVRLDLDYRAELLDEWMSAATKEISAQRRPWTRPPRRFASERPPRSSRTPSIRPPATHPSVPPSGM